jgi:nucleoid-associated protein YgaU
LLVQCFRCDQPAVQECARCGALYCDDHGDALCERCMDPNSALPSYRVYRGSLMALLIGSVFAVWLLVRPGGETDQTGPPAALAAVLPTQTPTLATPPARTPAPGASPTPTASPATTATAAPVASATPARTATPAASTPTPANRTYTVKPGDTLYGIADQYRGTVPLADYFERILTLNGLRETSLIAAGDVIRIPPP